MRTVFAFLAIWLCVAPATAHEYLVGDLAIIHPHTPPTAPESVVAHGYMELFNGGAEPEALLAVRSGLADISFFDPNADDGNGARVADAIEIAPGQSVLLGPETLQIRFAGLDDGFRIGDRFLATLIFQNAGQVTVEFWVEGTVEVPIAPVPAALPDAGDRDGAVDAIRQQVRQHLGPDTQITSVSVAGSAAVVGWLGQGEAGRAFLRHANDAWSLVLLSGESLVSPAGLRAQGLSPRVATALLAEVQSTEQDLPAATLAQLNAFQGTLILSQN